VRAVLDDQRAAATLFGRHQRVGRRAARLNVISVAAAHVRHSRRKAYAALVVLGGLKRHRDHVFGHLAVAGKHFTQFATSASLLAALEPDHEAEMPSAMRYS